MSERRRYSWTSAMVLTGVAASEIVKPRCSLSTTTTAKARSAASAIDGYVDMRLHAGATTSVEIGGSRSRSRNSAMTRTASR